MMRSPEIAYRKVIRSSTRPVYIFSLLRCDGGKGRRPRLDASPGILIIITLLRPGSWRVVP
jgi:hypothetical protein